jgi:hypothetical protein
MRWRRIGGAWVLIHAFLASALDGGEFSASRSGKFTPRERAPGTHWIGGWVGPRAVVDAHTNQLSDARFVIFMAVKIQVEFFWVVTPHSGLTGYRRFGGPCSLHIQGAGSMDLCNDGFQLQYYAASQLRETRPEIIYPLLRIISFGFDSRQGLRVLLFTTASRPTLGSTQPRIQWVPGTLSLGVKWLRREADHSPHLAPRLRIRGCMYLLPHTSSWRGTYLSSRTFTFTLQVPCF